MPDRSRLPAHVERRQSLDELSGRPADASQRGGVPDRGDHASTGPVKLRSSRASDQFSAFPDAQGTPSDNNGLVPPPLPGAAGQPAIPVRSASAPARLHGIRSPEGAVIDTTRSSCLVSGMALDEALLGWLLDTDPALRWHVERDLAKERDVVWAATRTRVAEEGMGARLLELQDGDGQWAGGAYFPSRADPRAVNHPDDGEGQPYTATTWSLNTLREWGVDASVLAGTAEKLTVNSRWEYDDLPYWGGEVDCCINAYTLANGAWLGAEINGRVDGDVLGVEGVAVGRRQVDGQLDALVASDPFGRQPDVPDFQRVPPGIGRDGTRQQERHQYDIHGHRLRVSSGGSLSGIPAFTSHYIISARFV